MVYRKHIETTAELADWYDRKYLEMGDGWHTPPEECNKHLDDLGVPLNLERTLLDIGCGAGHFLAEAQRRVKCVGIEISMEGVRLSKARALNSTIILFSIEDELRLLGEGEGFDYIVSIGSLEHIVNLDPALEHVYRLLKPDGRWYFYCPNENWHHDDQPNERTMTDQEWITLFAKHGLRTTWLKRWGGNQDNTAFCGVRGSSLHQCGINAGSGQRPFDKALGWTNIDINPRWNPDVICDWNDLSQWPDGTVDYVVSHHSLEHVGCGEGDGFIRESYRVLNPGGSLLVFVPDTKAIARRYVLGEIDEYTYNVNVYGAYMGDEADRHKWSYSGTGLFNYLKRLAPWTDVHAFDWRAIPGASIARDWWILGMEAVK